MKRFLKIRYFLSSFTALLFLLTPTQAEPIQQLNAEWIDGDNSDEALISGNWLVGVHYLAANTDERPSLMARLPGSWSGKTICARATNRTGRYFEFFQIDVPKIWNSDLTKFTYPTKYADTVRKLDQENSGLALHAGSCQSSSNEFTPVHWNSSADLDVIEGTYRKLKLNMNVGRADEIQASAKLGETELPISCGPVDEPGRTSFNHQCTIKVASPVEGVINLTIVRMRSGNSAKPRTAAIHIVPNQ